MKIRSEIKIAYLWYDHTERISVGALIRDGIPNCKLVEIPEDRVVTISDANKMMYSDFDIVLLHLSQPSCLALKMAEIRNSKKCKSKIAIISATRADPFILNKIYDGFIPKSEIHNIAEIVLKAIDQERPVPIANEVLMKMILDIIHQDSELKRQINDAIGLRYKICYTEEDYYRTVESGFHSRMPIQINAPIAEKIFISYSEKDHDLAEELYNMISSRNISCFMSEISLRGGDLWTNELRQRIAAAQVIVILMTPNSINSNWILIEAGAAWALSKKIIPCIAYLEICDLPDILKLHQVRRIITQEEKLKLVSELAESNIT